MRPLSFVLALCFVVGAFTGNALAQQKPIELSLNLFISQTHLRYVYAIKPWIAELEKRTQGRLKVTPYFSATMGPANENYESAAAGLADMADSFIGVTPGRFPISEISWLPDVKIDCKYPSYAIWDIYKKYPEVRKEWSDTQVIGLNACRSFLILTAKKQVRSLEDLKGLKLSITTKSAADTAKQLGASPATVSLGDLYSAAEKGVVDGAILPTDLLEARRLAEVFHYGTRAALGYDTFYMVMNKKKYNSLPEDLRKVVDDLSGQYTVDLFAKAWFKIIEQGANYAIEKNKFQFIDLSPAELSRWEKAIKPLWNKKAADLEAKGLPGNKILADWSQLLEKYNH